MNITTQLTQQLSEGEKRSLTELVSAIPELTPPQGLEVLHLLLRLDRQFRRLDDGRWTLATAPLTPEQRVVVSAQAYLNRIPGGGALLDSLLNHVIDETGYDRDWVRSIIVRRFVSAGPVVRNQLKETQ